MTIRFGTSDWRAVIGDEFTFDGVRCFGELINENKIVIGREESAGLSIKGHFPEKDGILACLLAAEAVAARGASLTEQLNDLSDRVGKLESGRIGIRLTPALMQSFGDKLKEDPREIGGRRVERNQSAGWGEVYFCGRFIAVDAAFGDRTSSSHLRGIRISNGLGGAS